MKSDIDIARAATTESIVSVAAKIGIPADAVLNYGPTKAKINMEFISSLKSKPNGKLVLVTAMTPTPAGEGKTTTTVGLGDGLNAIGKKAIVCLREPSLGPCFGMKGGAAGGGGDSAGSALTLHCHPGLDPGPSSSRHADQSKRGSGSSPG